MPIWLLRHAEAVAEELHLSDEGRYLTERGRADALALGRTMARLGIAPSAVVASPLVRAVQTAELVAASACPHVSVEILEALAPGRMSGRALALVAERDGALFVGHEPSISALTAALIESRGFPAFEKAQLVLVEGRAARWRLLPGDDEVRRYEALSP